MPESPTPTSQPPSPPVQPRMRGLSAMVVGRAIGDGLRFRILNLLRDGPPASAAELSRPLRADRTTISKAMHYLLHQGLLVRAEGLTRDGRHSRFMIDPAWRDPADPRALDFGHVRVRFA